MQYVINTYPRYVKYVHINLYKLLLYMFAYRNVWVYLAVADQAAVSKRSSQWGRWNACHLEWVSAAAAQASDRGEGRDGLDSHHQKPTTFNTIQDTTPFKSRSGKLHTIILLWMYVHVHALRVTQLYYIILDQGRVDLRRHAILERWKCLWIAT